MPVRPRTELAHTDDIPVIDFTDAWSDSSARWTVVEDIRGACTDVGFFYVKNHGIPDMVVERSLSVSQQFFALNHSAKLMLYQEDPISVNMGYRPFRDSNIDPSNSGDLMEGVTFQWQARADDASNNGNKWPAEAPAMRDGVLDYYDHALRLGVVIYRLLALAIGVEEDFFADKTKSAISRMRLLHYPEQKKEVVGAGAHSDFGTFTILLQQPGIPALQVKNADGVWIEAPPIPGTLVVNLGDQTSRLTNGVFRSAPHRVLSRPGADRYSIPLFFLADFDVPLEPIASCVSAERPRRYGGAAETAGEQFEGLIKATRVR
ncbi:Clavaminate synthase-like protein [Mycena sp. CBHHK59/15]|nr:Clavaminate synthase-like protein [Mycena sp. CBHHK59/15]